jgi:hypothetical protein
MSKSNTKKFLKKSGNKTHKKKYQKKTKTTYGRKIRGGNTMKDKKGGFWPFTSTPKPTQPDGQQQKNGFTNMFGLLKTPTKEELLANLNKEKQKCIDDIDAKIANVNKTNSQTPAPAPGAAPAVAPEAPEAPEAETKAPPAAPGAESVSSNDKELGKGPKEYSPPQPQPRLGGLKRKHRKHM